MTCHDEVLRIGKKLEKMIATKTSNDVVGLELLKTLKCQPMTLDVLQKTRIGMTVNGFRKLSKNEESISLAKSLIKIWKKLLQDNNGASSTAATVKGQVSSSTPASRSTSGRAGEDTDSRDSLSQSEVLMRGVSPQSDSPKIGEVAKNSASVEKATTSRQPLKATPTSDGVRLKCRQYLTNVLRYDKYVDGYGKPDLIAAAIEEAIFQEFKSTDMKYKHRIRSRVTNLQDPKNPRLRLDVLLGAITPENLAVMTSEDMASKELQALRQKQTNEAIDEHNLAQTASTPTDLFLCSQCEKRDTVYNQVQTSSEDEPTTTFILCNNCGYRWKVV